MPGRLPLNPTRCVGLRVVGRREAAYARTQAAPRGAAGRARARRAALRGGPGGVRGAGGRRGRGGASADGPECRQGGGAAGSAVASGAAGQACDVANDVATSICCVFVQWRTWYVVPVDRSTGWLPQTVLFIAFLFSLHSSAAL